MPAIQVAVKAHTTAGLIISLRAKAIKPAFNKTRRATACACYVR
ncbi:MAG TPA: hypothetical protein VJG32_21645 [Anaerolineae bacterium]|nr:hypothetical protein [Anaerolineae bacterium]